MKINIEASILLRKNKTGVDHYTFNLIKNTVNQMPRSTFILSYISFFTKKPADLGIHGENVIYQKLQLFPGRIYHALLRYTPGFPYNLLARGKFDIFIFPNFFRWPLLGKQKSIIFVYDLSFIHASKYHVQNFAKFMARVVPKSIKKATHIVTISENSKNEIMEEYGTPVEKISVVYPAVNHKKFYPRSTEEIKFVKRKFNIQGPYILCVGTVEPRKNLIGLLRSFEMLPDKLKSKYTLVISGGKGWLDDEINSEFNKISSNYEVIKTGYVDDEDLPALFSGADLFVFPSHYEGFGMPPLEAMACGTPVVVGNNSSLPEVVGSAGILVDSNNIESIMLSIEKVLSSQQLQKDLIAAGRKQALKFTWEKSGEDFKKVLEKVAGV